MWLLQVRVVVLSPRVSSTHLGCPRVLAWPAPTVHARHHSPGARPFSVASPRGVTHRALVSGRRRAVPSCCSGGKRPAPSCGGLPSAGLRSCPFPGCQPSGGCPRGRAPWGWAEALVGTTGSLAPTPCGSPYPEGPAQRAPRKPPAHRPPGQGGSLGWGASESRHRSETWKPTVRTGLGVGWGGPA